MTKAISSGYMLKFFDQSINICICPMAMTLHYKMEVRTERYQVHLVTTTTRAAKVMCVVLG